MAPPQESVAGRGRAWRVWRGGCCSSRPERGPFCSAPRAHTFEPPRLSRGRPRRRPRRGGCRREPRTLVDAR
eukprot:8546475-Lingulodinium_polyedra.AAC.1